MSCFINPVAEDQCVFLSCEGQTPLLEIAAARYEAGDCLAVRHWRRLVVDITQLRILSPAADLSRLVDALSADLPPHTRVALVVGAEQAGHARLARFIARNRGVPCEFFFDVEPATRWAKQTAPCREKPCVHGKPPQPAHF